MKPTTLTHLQDICDGFNGRIGLHARNLQTGDEIAINADDSFPTASTVKLPVLTTLMQQVHDGDYTLDDPLMLRRADKTLGSGLLKNLTPGLTMPLRDWAFLMMNISDNTATNVLIDHVGIDNVAAWLADHDFPDITLHNKLILSEIRDDLYHFGTATPRGLGRLMTAVHQRQIVSEPLCDEMMRAMNKVGSERVGRYLPFEEWDSDTPEAERLQLAGKTGSFKGCRAQTAVVWRGKWQEARGFALTVMTEGDPAPELWSVDAAGVLVIGRIAQTVYEWIMEN